MFLKKIEMYGFKSFADKTTIDFNQQIIGIVGPNGCGKSNISDSIRWVLGEQSPKSLRGDKMSDVIFSGTTKRKGMNFAEVSLYFDNTKRYFNYDQDEVELSRRVYLENQESEYLINKKLVRLKDVQDLILDSGLGKDTLSIISQGNVNAFAEAKSQDRRSLFEDAAGVSKYKKKKIESISKLERTQQNLERTLDIVKELENQLKPLEKQAKKAELFLAKKEELSKIEISFLINEINTLKNEIVDLKKEIAEIELKNSILETTLQVNENDIFISKEEINKLDIKINKNHEDLINIVNKINSLEKDKIEINEKRKYILSEGNRIEKIKTLNSIINDITSEISYIEQKLIENNKNIEILNKNYSDISYKIAEEEFKREELYHKIRKLENRKEILEEKIKNPFDNHGLFAVKTIIENKDSLYGIMGVVGQVLIAQEGYEEALKEALSSATNHIVVKDDFSARNAVDFLKKNKSGRATFIPLNILKKHNLSEEHQIICENFEGYLGILSDFVSCDNEFEILKKSFLGNIILCDNLENANKLSDLIKRNYKIVTLDGDVVNKGGSITGGKNKNDFSIISANRDFSNINKEIDINKTIFNNINSYYNQLLKDREEIEKNITNLKISNATIENSISNKKLKYKELKNDFDFYNEEEDSLNENNLNLDNQLENSILRKEELLLINKNLREDRIKLNNELDRKENQNKIHRKELNINKNTEKNLVTNLTKKQTQTETHLQRLANEYNITYEYAVSNIEISNIIDKDTINKLKNEIDLLGNVNLNAQEDFKLINERYNFMKSNYDELLVSRDKILEIIDDLDKTMKKQFQDTFDAINQELDKVFKILFGGGSARLVLEDSNNILESGIDIDVQPPGKSIKSIKLFSGGEKALIAISVLFAILNVKTVPLIVFDEVEAALDQANVVRFANYIRDNSKNTQFIIITHRPGTMEKCDYLYGVTMQKQGISQLLSVKLVDAITYGSDKESV